MGLKTTFKELTNLILRNKAKEEFDIYPRESERVDAFIERCAQVYAGNAPWVDEDTHIKTINFAKSIASETARLTCIGIGIKVDGSKRAEWLQKQLDKAYFSLRHWVEYGAAYGTIVLKPNGEDIDVVMPSDFLPTHRDGDKIVGGVFQDFEYDPTLEKWYIRLEYHRFVKDKYIITNKCFVGDSKNDTHRSIAIEKTPWNGMLEEAVIDGLEKPLFSVLRMPQANNIDMESPMGLPVYADAITELEDLDIAYSRNVQEIIDSRRTVLLDSDRLMPTGEPIGRRGLVGLARAQEAVGLPDYIKTVYGDGANDIYHEINPTLNTETRIRGINSLLSQIGYKCGFSNGYFVFNEKSGMVTATQVESDDRRTLQFIKDVRDKLESALDDLIYALDKFADLYDYAPVGKYEVHYDFGDIVYSYEQDKATWWGYVLQGKVPAWKYFEKFENMTEEEAKELVKEAQDANAEAFQAMQIMPNGEQEEEQQEE